MRLFSEKVTPTYTRSTVNILTVEDFQEIFYDIYEITINNEKFIAEKISEYKGAPVVSAPVIIEGIEGTLSFVLAKGKFEVLIGNATNIVPGDTKKIISSANDIPIKEDYQTPRIIKYKDKGNIVEEIVQDNNESIKCEIKIVKEQANRYEEGAKLDKKITRYINDCKKEIYSEIEQKYDDSILSIGQSNIALKTELQESLQETTGKLQESLEETTDRLHESVALAEEKIKAIYNDKIALLEESILENKQYIIDLINSSRQSILRETESIKNNALSLIKEKAFEKKGVDLKEIKSELEKIIGTRFNSEITALKRLIELSSGGGSVAKQFAEGGFMNGDLTVNGLISAQNLTITGTISANMIEALSANIRYLDINTYELSGFHSTGDVSIDGNLTVTGTISTTMLEAISANITYIDIKQYELSGFDVTGDVDIDGNLSVTGTISGKSYVNDPTGRVIIVDGITGTDTRVGLIKYDQFKPYKTIAAAIADSTAGDMVYVRAGSYILSAQVPLDNKGNIYFETGSQVSVGGGVSVFTLTANETKLINGYANFVIGDTASLLNQIDGSLTLDFNTLSSSSTNVLFALGGGTLNTSFININAPSSNGFTLTGSSNLIVRKSHSATCKQFLNFNTTGNISLDVWEINGTSTDATIRATHAAEFLYRGVNFANSSSRPCIAFAYSVSGVSAILKDVKLQTSGVPIICENTGTFCNVFLDAVKLNNISAFTPSISASPITTTVYSTAVYSNALPHSSVTVNGQYNLMTKIF